MAQNDPNDPNSGISSGTTGNIGSGGTSTGAGYSSGGTGTGMTSGGGMTTGSGGTGSDLGTGGTSGFGVSSGSDLGGGSSSGGGPIGSGSGGFSGGGGTSGGGGAGGGSTADSGASAAEEYCAHCGQSLNKGGAGIEGLLNSLRSQLGNVDVDEYLSTAREYLKGSSTKVTTYTRDNPAKVAAGVAALALGAGLIYAAVNRGKDTDTSNATTDTMNPPGSTGGTGPGGVDTSRDRGL